MEGVTATSIAAGTAAAAAYPPYFSNGHHVASSPQQTAPAHSMSQEPMSFLGEPGLGGLNIGNIPDMGFTEDVLMSEQWMNLMRETGILDSNGNFAGVQNGTFLPQELMF